MFQALGCICLLLGPDTTKQNKSPPPTPKRKKQITSHHSTGFYFFTDSQRWRVWFCPSWWWLIFLMDVGLSVLLPCGTVSRAALGLLHAYSFNHFSHILESVAMSHTRSPYLNFQKTSNRLLAVCHFVSKISKYCDKWNDSTEFSQPGCRPGEWGVTDRNRC